MAAIQDEIIEDEIDIRAAVETVFRYKWIILGTGILLALLGFLVSKLILAQQFRATSLIVIREPSFTANFDERIITTLEMPDINIFADLVLSDDVLKKVSEAPEVVALNKEYNLLRTLKNQMNAVKVGANQLRLEVVDSDPQNAATLVNAWSDVVVVHLNNLFGFNSTLLSQIEQQKEVARQNWVAAEQVLLDYLPDNRVEVLSISLTQSQDVLKRNLDKIYAIEILISDSHSLEARLENQSNNSTLLLKDALNIISLHQRATGNFDGLQIQFSTPDIFGEDYTVSDARTGLGELVASLENQKTQLVERNQALEESIVNLSLNLEAAKFRVSELTVQRDLALSSYQALSNQEEETRIALSQEAQTARIASYALPPETPIAPRPLMNTAIAGSLGLILACLAVFAIDWWRKPTLDRESIDRKAQAGQPPMKRAIQGKK